jgi:small subunit ribosomal protein S21
MLIIKVNKEKSIEVALKHFKNKVQKTKLLLNLRKRKEFEKPSVTRRREVNKSIYREKGNFSNN